MATYSKEKLSGSTNGRGLKVAATTIGSADTIHTAGSGTSNWDEVWIYAFNSATDYKTLTICWGGTTSPDDTVTVDIPPLAGPVLIIPGWIIQNSLVVKAYAETTNVVMVHGFVNRITA